MLSRNPVGMNNSIKCKLVATLFFSGLTKFDEYVEFMSHLDIDTVEKIKDAADVHLKERDLLLNSNYPRDWEL